MKFSVLMSLYIKEKHTYFNDAMESVYRQTIQPDEVVIVHDGPLTRDLYDVIESWKPKLNIVEVILEDNKGLGFALNLGVQACSHELIARVDTDDINLFDRFELQLEKFSSNISLAICGTDIEEVNCDDLSFISYRKTREIDHDIKEESIRRNPFNHMTVMYKKSAILSVGNYQHMTSMEDWYLWLRLISNNYQCYNIQRVLVKARTGKEMMERRSGLNYVLYEYFLTIKKIKLFPKKILESIIYFFLRSLPRLLPKRALQSFYLLTRDK